jgi:hypothetical protein
MRRSNYMTRNNVSFQSEKGIIESYNTTEEDELPSDYVRN